MLKRNRLTRTGSFLLGIGLFFGLTVALQAEKPNPANENIVRTTSGEGGFYSKIIWVKMFIDGKPISAPVYTWDLTNLRDNPPGRYKLKG